MSDAPFTCLKSSCIGEPSGDAFTVPKPSSSLSVAIHWQGIDKKKNLISRNSLREDCPAFILFPMSFTSTEKSGATRYLSGELSFYRLHIHFRFRSASSCAIFFNKSSKLAGVSTLFPHLCLARPRLRTCFPHASQV